MWAMGHLPFKPTLLNAVSPTGTKVDSQAVIPLSAWIHRSPYLDRRCVGSPSAFLVKMVPIAKGLNPSIGSATMPRSVTR